MSESIFTDKTVWVAGHTGLVGSAVCRLLERYQCQIMTVGHAELDLTRQIDTEKWLLKNKPDIIINCAGKVGGIDANRSQPADFMVENLQIGLNIIHGAYKADISKLVCLGSSCFYPAKSPQPINENNLLEGTLEATNEAYALAKIATIKLCSYYNQQYGKDFIGIVPTNLYGPGDSYDPVHGHVIASLIYKFHQASIENSHQVNLWGTGSPLREFMYVDDAAAGILFLVENYSGSQHINLCGGETVSIRSLADSISQIMNYQGTINFDTTKPDGMMKKSLDNSLIKSLGWKPQISLVEGLRRTINDFVG